MATYPDLTKINLNQNIFGGYNNPIAANYANKLSFIQQYYPKYGSTDARSIDMMYNKAVELTNAYGSSQKSKIGSQLAQTLRTAQSGNMQQPIQKESIPVTNTGTSSTSSGTSTRKTNSKVNAVGTQNISSSNNLDNFKMNDNAPSAFSNIPTVQDNISSLMNYNNPNSSVVQSPVIKNPNYNASDAFNFDWKLPNQNGVVPQNNTTTGGYVNPEPSMFQGDNRISSEVVIPDISGAVNGSGSNAFQKAMDLQNTLSNKWGNTSYGDAWTQGNGVLGGISNMWDKFTSPNGSMANPTPSGAENFLKSLGGVGTLAGGVADLMYKSKLADLMGRQVSQQEALQNATLKSKNDWEKSYAGSFK